MRFFIVNIILLTSANFHGNFQERENGDKFQWEKGCSKVENRKKVILNSFELGRSRVEVLDVWIILKGRVKITGDFIKKGLKK